MNYDYENTANDFLELASKQRLYIILRLLEKKYTISVMAKELNATVPEVFRNFGRLAKAGLIIKDPEGDYDITTYGKILCGQIQSITFLSQNKKYFKEHDFGDLPQKFLQRIGSLVEGHYVKGFVKVLEKWNELYKNSNEYIYNILAEVPYTQELMELLVDKMKNGVKINSIFSEYAVIPKERKQIVEKLGFKKFIDEGIIQRKMKKDVKLVVILNEKEACVMFPTLVNEVDVSQMFYSDDPLFHEWCLDYFLYCWNTASSFQESKFK